MKLVLVGGAWCAIPTWRVRNSDKHTSACECLITITIKMFAILVKYYNTKIEVTTVENYN